LGLLVSSFNQMTAQLADNRRQLDQFTHSLQQAVQELEQRRTLLETILESIPTGVISLSPDGAVRRVNPAGEKMFGSDSRKVETLDLLMGDEAARSVKSLMRRALRMGTASQDLEIAVASGRLLHAAVTVSALGPRRANLGYIVVVDDLTELLGAQKAAAWQEVAQRIAHEIKNPLTPIQLSAQRLTRFLDRQGAAAAGAQAPELVRLAGECAGLIQREVTTLESLVKEFSDFARFPRARLESIDPNAIAQSALEIFSGRLDGIRVRATFEPGLPSIRADAEQLRRVLVNLIDNAAESMEGSSVRELTVETRADDDRETVTLIVADSGHGISPEDKDKLFLPHFSTKDRGTGLGLAISSRIVAEHNGTLRVEDNTPVGARFILQIPVAEVRAAPLSTES
jgi:PAS domain S-box-containing protein